MVCALCVAGCSVGVGWDCSTRHVACCLATQNASPTSRLEDEDDEVDEDELSAEKIARTTLTLISRYKVRRVVVAVAVGCATHMVRSFTFQRTLLSSIHQNAGFSPAEIKARAAVLAGTSEGPIDPAWKALERWEGEESLDPELFADVYARYQEVRACVRASLFCGW